MRRRTAVLLVALAACGSASPALAQWRPPSCETPGKNLFVRDVMTDLYLWYQEIPAVDPTAYSSPEAYLEAIRYRPLDSTFSYITSRAANDAFFSASQYIGLGLSTAIVGGEMRVLQVFPDSPAHEAGLARGDRIVEIDGTSVDALIASGRIAGAFGPPEAGAVTTVVFRTGAGERRTARMIKRAVTIPTVSHTTALQAGGRRVGYVFFRNFVEPSFDALDVAFAQLAEAGIEELVLDLRYNGGGLVDVAQRLASLVGGLRTEGQVFAEYFHNDRNSFRNHVVRFEAAPSFGPLQRLIVITTRASASASELVINALRPFMPVVVIGDRTYGKPVGQYGIEFCDKVLAPVSFVLRNANGEGDFFDGFAPDCAAPDDVDHQLGDPAEGSLREALVFVATGACSAGARALAATAAARRPDRATGWQAVVNAY